MYRFCGQSLLLLLFVVTCGNAGNIFSGHSCTIPGNQTGRCVIKSKCLVYKEALEGKHIKNVEFLRHLQCGTNPDTEKVCCPVTGNYTYVPIEKPSRRKQRPLMPVESVLGDRFGDDELIPTGDKCGQQTTEKLYGGEITAIDEFPWMALLRYKRKLKNGSPILACGGVLINKRYVLTAAHCVKGPEIETLQGLDVVRLGEYNILEEEDCVVEQGELDCADPIVELGYEEIISHPLYNPKDKNQYHDIALIRLESNVVLSDFIQPICLPIAAKTNVKLSPGAKFFVSGWGRTEYKDQPSPVKLKLLLPIADRSQCVQPYTRFGINLKESQICAGGQLGYDTCKGDSGGPLMCTDDETGNWITSGVVSIGPNNCGRSHLPGIYTNVKDYIDWIIANVKP